MTSKLATSKHINRDNVPVPPVIFTPAPRARETRRAKVSSVRTMADQPVTLQHSRYRREVERTKSDATGTMQSSTRAFSVDGQTPAKGFILQHPAFLTLGWFDKLVYLLFLVSCVPFFRALGGFGVDVASGALGSVEEHTDTSVAKNRTTPMIGDIAGIAPIYKLGVESAEQEQIEFYSTNTLSTPTPNNEGSSQAPANVSPRTQLSVGSSPNVQASPIDLPWPIATPSSADHIFDFGSPDDVFALRIHSLHDLAAQQELLGYGDRWRPRRIVNSKGG